MARNPLHPIPNPPPKPFVGNLFALGSESPSADMAQLAREYGPIYWLELGGIKVIVVSSQALVNELCDDSRFDKNTRGTLRRLRALSHGMFTSDTPEPTWSKPHNILLANFSQRAMQAYHPMMLDVAEQLVAKWQRQNFDDEIDVVRDMTALTLDTIGLCGFGYRFNSFYREGFHPFVDAMVRTLETVQLIRGIPFEKVAHRKELQKQEQDIAYMHAMVERIVAERRASGADIESKPDLLSYMIAGVDRKTGERLDDVQIRDECIEFLIAGHETTSGLLSFAIYSLLKEPLVLAKAYAEVDAVLGPDVNARPTYAQVNRLVYLQQVLKEALRLYPTAPAFSLYAKADTTIGGQYPIRKRNMIVVLSLALHRDKAAWGDNADAFDPENFSREAEAARAVNAYKPFGNGQRACIGRQFAMQEAVLTLGLVLQRFELVDHLDYRLKVKEALTIKPDGLRIKVRLRGDRGRGPAEPAAPAASTAATGAPAEAPQTQSARHGTPLLVLHGSNLGTAEEFARQLAEAAGLRGYAPHLASLDDFAERLPATGATAIVCASYNGAAPDNAAQFARWLRGGGDSLAGVRYAVFGCGHRDWAATYQSVPREIDDALAAHGAARVHERGEGDARDDIDGAFQAWSASLWPALGAALGVAADAGAESRAEPLYAVEEALPSQAQSPAEAHGAVPLVVLQNVELQSTESAAPSPRSTRHLELRLPHGVRYEPGDHLCVVPHNAQAQVERVLRRYGYAPDAHVRLRAAVGRKGLLPVDEAVAVRRLLAEYVELQAVATRRQIALLAEHTPCPFTKPKLAALAAGDDAAQAGAPSYKADVLAKSKSVLDLLDEFPACQPPFGVLLEMLPALAPRYYSISSSPLACGASRCSVTVGVVQGPARSGRGTFEGVCSTYLARAEPGSVVQATVRPSTIGFRLPEDPSKPVIMIGPGTGLAPFRGFLQQRAAEADGGASLGEALLFFGCRRHDEDFLYADELHGWDERGVVRLHVAFSREDDGRKVYVQHLLREQAEDVWRLLEAGAMVYVCGDGSRMEPDVRRTLAAIAGERLGGEAAGAAWMDALARDGRYLLDVWAGN